MLTVRKSDERGHFDHGWLDTYHTFSFGDYRDLNWMGFRSLRVINDDRVAPATGFGTPPHRDMEIITYVLSGGLEHHDSMGNGSVIRPGEAQRMTAGTGIMHSEKNPSRTDPVHLLQIWILPNQKGLTPGYEQKQFADEAMRNRWRLLGARDGRDGAVTIHQDVDLFVTRLEPNHTVTHTLPPNRYGWLQVATGSVSVNGTTLEAGDGAAIANETAIEVTAQTPAEVLLFDLA
jgi:redox-sensitive bicupin YhaK (pirin superfamily)